MRTLHPVPESKQETYTRVFRQAHAEYWTGENEDYRISKMPCGDLKVSFPEIEVYLTRPESTDFV